MISERVAAGKLIIMPTTVEAAATKPSSWSVMPSELANRGSAGLLDIVELKIARPPIMQSNKKGEILFIGCDFKGDLFYESDPGFKKISLFRR
jgi:hypothetical protein